VVIASCNAYPLQSYRIVGPVKQQTTCFGIGQLTSELQRYFYVTDSSVCRVLLRGIIGKLFTPCLLMHQIHTGRAPQYLVESVQSASCSSRRRLRSTDAAKYIKRTTRTKFGERCFSHAGPAAGNCLPPHLQAISETFVFERNLKSHLFTDAFS